LVFFLKRPLAAPARLSNFTCIRIEPAPIVALSLFVRFLLDLVFDFLERISANNFTFLGNGRAANLAA